MKRINMAEPVFNGREKQYLNECIDTGWVSANGRFVHEFEEKFADFCGTKYAVSCSNGTVSLHLCLMGLGIGLKDEVIMPALTYIATANSVKYCGAKPVFVDSEPGTFNIDPSKIEEKITEHTKAIIPVHLYGLSADMDEINRIAKKHHLYVIEDAAEAHGALYKGKKVGSLGEVASFSFFGNKIITAGEGGMVTTNSEELYKKMKLLKGQGVSSKRRYWHEIVGYNYRMTNMQAAVGLAQLEQIDWHISQRKRVADLYQKYLKGTESLFQMQSVPADCKSVYWMNNVILSEHIKKSRDTVMEQMEQCSIEMRPVFYPMHIMPPYYDRTLSMPVAEGIAERGISLPLHALLSEEDIAYICECLIRIVTK
ncbi:MAG: DegT/DnrJ/EryC1/StrS family aminotransferase [Lachnospiraceae bacterium]|nr:DegT/DnrJ/EryC1/StrS family aminotransferase [Lachnospiraceae bacterium]